MHTGATGAIALVPNVVGDTRAQAEATLKQAGYIAPAFQATITGHILLAGPSHAVAIPGTVWAYAQNIRGQVVASADTDPQGAFTLVVPAPGVYVIGGDSPQFNGGSPIPDHPVPACVSSPISVSPQTPATVQVLCQAQ